MRILLDTCTLIWIFEGSTRIGSMLRNHVTDLENEVFMSDVNILEAVIKFSLGKLPLPRAPSNLIPILAERHGLAQLPIDSDSIFAMEKLPLLHRDPFDRLLIAQAQVHGFEIETPDPKIAQYAVRTIW